VEDDGLYCMPRPSTATPSNAVVIRGLLQVVVVIRGLLQVVVVIRGSYKLSLSLGAVTSCRCH